MEHVAPFRAAALEYREAGWHGTLPIPAHSKRLNLRGWTGHDGAMPSYADVQAWSDGPEGNGNIALRVPPDVLGIDVDAYPGKSGAATLATLESQAGPLPHTWISSARTDGISGIYFFRVPVGLNWPGEAGPHVELVQYGHRYAVVWPSWNPDADAQYKWTPPDTYNWGRNGDAHSVSIDVVLPVPSALPDLPDSWVEMLSSGLYIAQSKLPGLSDSAVDVWLRATDRVGVCRSVRHAVSQCGSRLRAGSRHEALNAAVLAIVRLGEQGHRGMVVALTDVRRDFAVVADDRSEGESAGEWRRAVAGALALVLGTPSRPAQWPLEPCRCNEDLAHDLTPPPRTRGTQPPVGSLEAEAEAPVPETRTRGTQPIRTRAEAPVPEMPLLVGEEGREQLAVGAPQPQADPPDEKGDADTPATAAHPELTEPPSLVLSGPLPNTPLVTDVDLAVIRLRTQREARRVVDAEDASKDFQAPPVTVHLTEELQTPDAPIRFGIAEIMPAGSNVLLTAGFKTGKTTLINNVAKALADHEALLGRFDVAWRTGRVGLCNYEVGRDMYRRWLRDTRIKSTNEVVTLTLRGFRMPLIAPIVQDFFVSWLLEHEITFWIIDPFARAFVGSGEENSNDDVGVFLDTVDVIKQRANCPDLILTTHTGRMEMSPGTERSRGATRLDDWADVRWLLTKDERDTRYFRATGRDVDFSETELRYDETARALFLGTQSRRGHKFETLVSAITQTVRQNPGIGTRALREEVRVLSDGFSQVEFDEAKRHLRTTKKLIVTDTGNRTTHHLAPTSGFTDGLD